MDNAIYAALTRQISLSREMDAVANNLANMSTNGYRAERVLFAEYVKASDGPLGSLSMATVNPRFLDRNEGPLNRTGGAFDLAIVDDNAFFQVQTQDGPRLTRAGSFAPTPEGALVSMDGHPLLDAGGAPVFVPIGGEDVVVSDDGTVSVDGALVAQVGLFAVEDPAALRHSGGVLFEALTEAQPAVGARVTQGFIEGSNVDPVSEVTRMIDVQRAYELSTALLAREDERIRQAVRKMGEVV